MRPEVSLRGLLTAGAASAVALALLAAPSAATTPSTNPQVHALAAAAEEAAPTGPFQVRGEPVDGAQALIDAPVLQPGTYSGNFTAGHTVWFAVDLGRGSNLTARLTVATTGVPDTAGLAVEWQDLSARRVDITEVPGITPGPASTIAVSTGSINGTRTRYGAVREPGRYYLGVRTHGFPTETPHAFVLELFLDGRLNPPPAPPTDPGAPQDDNSNDPVTHTTEPTDPADEPTDDATAAPAPDLPPPPESGGGGAVVFGGIVVLTSVGAVGYLYYRRRSKAQEAPPPPSYYG